MPYLIFDFDSTMIKSESLEEVADFALEDMKNKKEILEKISEITRLGMEGKIDFKESLLRRMSLIKINKKHIDLSNKKILNNITDSFLRNAGFIRTNAEKIYVISGGFKCSILPVTDFFNIDQSHIIANEFLFDENNNVIDIKRESDILKPSGKSLAVSNLKLEGEVIVIGDGYTDYQIKENGACDKFIAFCENIKRDNVTDKADFVANSLDDIIQITQTEN